MPLSKNNKPVCQPKAAESATAQFLTLCGEQIAAAVEEAVHEIDALSCAVLDSARHASAVLAAPSLAEAEADSQALQKAVRSATMRLQFADRLQQRLTNIAENLTRLAKLMQSIDLPITDAQWSEYLDTTRAKFTMEQERQMFDVMFGTATEPGPAASDTSVLFDTEANETGG